MLSVKSRKSGRNGGAEKHGDSVMSNSDDEFTAGTEPDSDVETLPVVPAALSQDERYFTLLITAIRKCANYKPKFGQGRGEGLSLSQFSALYSADPFYHWLGIDSPLMYAAHKAAGGMTSIYRQVGIGSQWIFQQMLQDCLGLSLEQSVWSYAVKAAKGRQRRLTLDGRITIAEIENEIARQRVTDWLTAAALTIGLPKSTLANIKGVVFEVRQGYKSKDSKRQNADIANASKAYAHLHIPVLLLFSTQIDGDVAQRYQENLWLLLNGLTEGENTASAYGFCRDIIGYDLADFFQRFSPRIRAEVEIVLKALLAA